jgi:hypothetical protein
LGTPDTYNFGLMDEREKELTKRWIETWRETGPLLRKIRDEELAAMTEDGARAANDAVLSMTDYEHWIAPERGESSGLVEQQRLFARLRRS